MGDPVLVARLEANVDKFEKQLARAYSLANKNNRDIENRFDRMSGNVSSGLGKVGAALAGALSVGALVAFAKQSIEAADNIGDAAERIGITAEKLQELHYVARLSGASIEEFDNAMLQLSKRIGKSDGEIDDVTRAFNKMGLRTADLKDLGMDVVFRKIADGIVGLDNQFEQAAVAVDLFGRGGQKMLPALRQGATEINRLAAEARKMGVIIPEDVIKRAGKADEEFKKLGAAWIAAGANLNAGLLDGLIKLREVMTDPQFQEGTKKAGENIGKIVEAAAKNPAAITALATALAGLILAGPKGAVVGGVGGFIVHQMTAGREAADQLRTRLELLQDEYNKLGAKIATTSNPEKVKTLTGRYAALGEEIEATQKKLAAIKPPAQVTVHPAAPAAAPPFVSEALDRKLEETALKTAIARGEFDQWADGLPEFISKLEDTRDMFKKHGADLDKYPQQVRAVNTAMKGLTRAEDLRTAAKEFGQAFSTAFENAIIDGKSLDDVIKQLTKDIQRMALRLLLLKPLEKTLEGAFTGIVGPSFGRMAGGPVTGGTSYIVGERGPELFIPGASGQIVPNSRLGGGAGAVRQTVVINDYSGQAKVRQSKTAQGGGVEVFVPAIEQMLAVNMGRGRGALSKTIDARQRHTNLYG